MVVNAAAPEALDLGSQERVRGKGGVGSCGDFSPSPATLCS